MECARHGEFDGFAGAEFFGQRNGEGDFGGFAGENDLARGVEIGDINVGGGGEVANAVFITANNRRHPPLGALAGVLHGACTAIDKPQTRGKIKRAGRGVRRELAERESGAGLEIELRKPCLNGGETREAVNIECRLADGRLCQFFRGAFKSDLRKGIAEHLVGLAKKHSSSWKFCAKVFTHADGLGPLAGEKESKFFLHK